MRRAPLLRLDAKERRKLGFLCTKTLLRTLVHHEAFAELFTRCHTALFFSTDVFSSHQGRDAAVALAKEGYTVYATVRKEKDAAELQKLNIPLLKPIIMDVTNEEQIAVSWERRGRGDREKETGKGKSKGDCAQACKRPYHKSAGHFLYEKV